MKQKMINLKNFYFSLNLQSKLMITYVVIISIPMILLGIFFYGKVYGMIVYDTIRNEQEESSKTAPAIESAIDEVLSAYNAVLELPFCEQVFSAEYLSTLDEILLSDDAATFSDDIQEIIDNSIVSTVRFYIDYPNEQSNALSDLTDGIFMDSDKINNTYWKGIFSGSGISTLYCSTFYLGNKEITEYGDLAYITKKSITMDQEIYTCYISVYYSSEYLFEILQNNLTSEGSVAYLINERDSIIVTTNPALSSTYYLNFTSIQDNFMSSNNFLKKTVIEEEIYAGMYNIKQPQWYMVVVIPSKPLTLKSNFLVMQYLFLYIVCIILAFLIAVLISRSITKRLSTVTVQMSMARTGPPIPLNEPDVHDEIGDLIDTYNYMSREMNLLLDERIRASEELRIAEFNSLQAQINPHFLYNTMDMINWMAVSGRTDEIVDAVQSLSRFYKLTLSKKNKMSTIGEEIEHVSIYVRLQNMRYYDRIDFVIDVPDELLEYKIPKLTLQPVIENSINHGIMEKEEKKGVIVLTGWIETDTIVLLISDDGIGITKEKLDHILTGKGNSKKGTNIGIYNIHHRLQILYGSEFGLSYQSTLGRGTDVSIRLPLKHKDPLNKPFQPKLLLSSSKLLENEIYLLHNYYHSADKPYLKENFFIIAHNVTEDFPDHSHDYIELAYLYRGKILNCIDGNEIIQHSGDLILINRKAIQSIKKIDKDALLINFCLELVLFETVLREYYVTSSPVSNCLHEDGSSDTNYIYFSLVSFPEIRKLLSDLILSYRKTDYHYANHMNTFLTDLFHYLSLTKEFSFYGPDKYCREILDYLKENFNHKKIEQISRDLYTTPSLMNTLLNKYTGRNLESFILENKLNLALELLEKPEINIYDIAQMCSFDKPDEFFTIFEDYFHISAMEYRKQFV